MGSDATRRNLEAWDRTFRARDWGRYPAEDLVRFIARTFGAVDDKSKIRILEIGCGPGANLWYLAREGFSIAAIDGSQTALDQALTRMQMDGLHRAAESIDLRQGNFAVLPWPDEVFDAAVDVESISANNNEVIQATIADAYRVLKPGAVLFAKMFGTETTGFDTTKQFEPNTLRNPADGPCKGMELAHFFDEQELRELFAKFSELTLDWSCRSDHGGRWRVFEWLVSARK
jgi:SAM-dependent methyltransferase